MFNALLQPLQNVLGSGLLVIFLTHALWFFGIPMILNPIFFLPFLLVPISNYLISYAAFYTGLVPHVVNTVDWTTPILLSGYKATDSIAGTILQIVCLTVGVLTYIPFVRLYEQQRARRMKQDVKRLVEEMQQEEQDMRITHLTKREDDLGHIARILASELEDAVKKQELYLVYQPQVDRDENCIGAEALLRWEHAEYVETETQRDKLKELGCDAFQGYLYSKPIRLKELLEWINERKDT